MLRFKILLILLVVGGLSSNVVLADTTAGLRPTADGGDDSADWGNTLNETPCNATNCYTGVDELSGSKCTNSSDGDVSYIISSINEASQTFDIDESSIPDNSTVTQIDITVCYRKQGLNGAFQTRYCHNGSCADYGENISSVLAEYNGSTQSHIVSFTKTSGSDIEIGVTNKKARNTLVSKISAVITYILPEEPVEGGPTGSTRRVKVAFSGQAYPESKIEVLRRGSTDEEAQYLVVPLEMYQVSADGKFNLSLGALVSDEYFFALRAEDRDGRKTSIIAFDVDLKTENILEAKDIFMPPTVALEKIAVTRGKESYIFGYAGSGNVIEVYIDNMIVKTAWADENGFWTALINTDVLTADKHSAKVRQIDSAGKVSSFSLAKDLRVSLLKIPQADFNEDDVINITDWSVFLFRWGQADINLRSTIDLNGDGQINIADFSVFLNLMKL